MTARAIGSRLVALALVLVLGATVLLAAGCGGPGDGGGDDPPARDATRASTDQDDSAGEDEPVGEDEPGEPTDLPDPVPAGELPPIQVTSPTPLAYVSRSFVLAGTAQVFEGELRWAILDAQLKPMAQGRMTASCGGPCRGKFRTVISLRDVEVGSWELHVWQPPVADDDPARVHDTMVPITVTAEPVEGAPDPGEVPPGGVPGG